MKCSICSNQDHTVFESSVYQILVCSNCYEQLAHVETRKYRNKLMTAILAIIIILIVCFIMMCNQSFAQTSDQDFVSANLRDSIGTLFCHDGSRLPCTPTYSLETRIIGWDLIYIQYERSYDYMVGWVPKYESVWRELK